MRQYRKLPTKWQIVQSQSRPLLDRGILVDWGEPSCWACGDGFEGVFDVDSVDATERDCAVAWDDAPLDRAHILAHDLGGSDKPDNFVLMCFECHESSPNVRDKEMFFTWLMGKRRSAHTGRSERMRQALQVMGVSAERFYATISCIKAAGWKGELIKWSAENSTNHAFSSKYEATAIANIIGFFNIKVDANAPLGRSGA